MTLRPPPQWQPASPALRLQPVAVAAEVQRPDLVLRLVDQVALAHKHFAVEANRLALRPVAPANHRPPARTGSERQGLQPPHPPAARALLPRRLAPDPSGRSSNRSTSTTVGLCSPADISWSSLPSSAGGSSSPSPDSE